MEVLVLLHSRTQLARFVTSSALGGSCASPLEGWVKAGFPTEQLSVNKCCSLVRSKPPQSCCLIYKSLVIMINRRCEITRDGLLSSGWAELCSNYAYTKAYGKNCYFVGFFLKGHTWSIPIGKQGNPLTFLQHFKANEQQNQWSFFPFSLLTLNFYPKILSQYCLAKHSYETWGASRAVL